MGSVSDVRQGMQETLWLRAGEFVRWGMQRWCQLVMEAERDAFLGCARHERTPARRGWRNGYESRRLQTRYGELRLRVPRVRRTARMGGTDRPWRTLVFDLYQRRKRGATTNPVERFILEIEKATGHVPVWEDVASWERHVWVLLKCMKRRSYRPTRRRTEITRTS